MPTKTKIEWADYVSNPLRATVYNGRDGFACVRKSEGCEHCWASRFNVRLGTGLEYTVPNLHKVSVYGKLKEIEAMRLFCPRGPFKNGRERALMFVCDMTDLFGEWVEYQDVRRVLDACAWNAGVDFAILTKRPEIAVQMLGKWSTAIGKALPNMFIGASVENERRAKERVGALRGISDLGFSTFVSYEPALEAVSWEGYEFIEWLICGGESGAGARPMSLQAARVARDFCDRYTGIGIPFFFKQWGEWAPVMSLVAQGVKTFGQAPVDVGGVKMARVGKGMAGCELDGQVWRQVPSGHGMPTGHGMPKGHDMP